VENNHQKQSFVLDSYALLAYFLNESGRLEIELTLRDAKLHRCALYLSDINIGEVYYRIWKLKGKKIAEETLKFLLRLPLLFVSVDREFILSAASWKGRYSISYADAFVVETAVRNQAVIVTGDPEFAAVKEVKIRKLKK
jgi:ribonuclease VapC